MQAIVGTPTEDDLCEARRAAIRESLDEIVNDVGMAMRDAGLDFPVNIIVPHSGDALVMVGSPLNPRDADCQRAITVICEIVGDRLGGRQLRGRELTCAVTNGASSAADVIADSPNVETGEDDVQRPEGTPRPLKATAQF